MKLAELQSQLLAAMTSQKYLIIVFLAICFLVVSWFTYTRYLAPKLATNYVTNQEYTTAPVGGVNAVDLYFFHTTWCPHCRTALPIWQEFKADLGTGKVKGFTVNFHEVDCEKDTATADRFKVTGYPSIKLVKGNQVIDYDAKPDKATLKEFLESSL